MGQFTNEMTTLSTQNILNESVLVSASTIAKYSEVPIQRSPIYFTNFTWISLKILIAENISYLCYLGIVLGEYTKYRDDSIGAVSRFKCTKSGHYCTCFEASQGPHLLYIWDCLEYVLIFVFPPEKEAWKFYHPLIIMTRVLLFCSLKPATSYLHSAKGVGERWKKGEGQKGPWSGFEGSSIPPSQLKIPSWMVLGWDTKRNILQNTIHPSCPFWRGRPCFYYIFLPNMSIFVMMLALQCFVAHYLSNLDHVWSKEPWHL